jgi:hypothetical protein
MFDQSTVVVWSVWKLKGGANQTRDWAALKWLRGSPRIPQSASSLLLTPSTTVDTPVRYVSYSYAEV